MHLPCPTRLDRGADCSQQTCWLGSAGLLSLVATMEKLLPCTRNDTFSNPRRYSFQHGKKLFPTRKDDGEGWWRVKGIFESSFLSTAAWIGDDKRVSVTIRRFHSLRSFHPRLFTFAPFGDGRMLLAKLQKDNTKILLPFLWHNKTIYPQKQKSGF